MLLLLWACYGDPPPSDDTIRDVETGDTADGADSAEPCAPDPDGDGWCGDDDCAPGDPERNPDAPEACNAVDDDCDGDIDEGLGGTYYADDDGDGYGNPEATTTECEPPGGAWVDNGADCDDDRAGAHPGAEETANGKDDDCDGQTDEGTTTPEVDVTVTWSRSGAAIVITGGTGPFDFGMAETGAGDAGWFGESCIPGDEPWGYPDYGYDVCHELSAGGGTLTWVADLHSVADGSTLFTETIADLGSITYVLLDQASDACWVWGDDPSYYDELGCTER